MYVCTSIVYVLEISNVLRSVEIYYIVFDLYKSNYRRGSLQLKF